MSQSKLIPETERAKYTKDLPDGILNANFCTSIHHAVDEVEIGGLNWHLHVLKKSRNGNEFLYISLAPGYLKSPPWNIELTAEFIVLHGSDPSKNVSQMHHYVLRNLRCLNKKGCYIMPWKEFKDKKKGFSGGVQLRITIIHGLKCNPSFDFSSSEDVRSDIVLMIEGKPVHANKQYLGLYSPVFQAMFFGESAEKDRSVIELKDVEYEDFIELLHVIYPSQRTITETCAEGLIELADRFKITSVIQRAEDVLIMSENLLYDDKIGIADRYKLFRLLEAGLSEVDCVDDAQLVKDGPVYKSLSAATKIALFERVLEKPEKISRQKPRVIPECKRTKYTRDPPDGIIEVNFGIFCLNSAFESKAVEIGGLEWQLGVDKRLLKKKEYLFLSLIPQYFESPPWKIKLTAEFILHHSTDNDKNVSQMLYYALRDDFTDPEGLFEDNPEPHGCYLIPWDELMDKERGFVQNEKISVEIRLTILKGVRCNRASFDFSSPGNIRSDVVLLIEGKPVHVNKHYLGLYSPFFQAMFFGEFVEKDKNEIELKDVVYEEFIELLHVIYPSQKRITDISAEYLIELADRFQITNVIHRAEDVLISSRRHTPMEKMRIADQHNLYRLMGSFLFKLHATEDVQAVKNDPIYESLSETTKIALRERELKFTEAEGETSTEESDEEESSEEGETSDD